MALTVIQITGRVTAADDTNLANTQIEFVLTGFDTDNVNDVTVVPTPIYADVDSSGDIDVSLYPNEDSERTRYYQVTSVVKTADKTARYSLGIIELPTTAGPHDLNDLLRVDPDLPASLSIQQKLDLKADQTSLDATDAAVVLLSTDNFMDPDAQAWLDAVGGVPVDKASLVNSSVQRLKIAGVWDALDIINIDFGVSEAAALRNLKDPSNLHVNNGATYTLGGGFQGDGTAAWVDTGLAFSGLDNYELNSAHMSAWVTTDIAATERDMGASSGATAYIISRSSGLSMSVRANDSSAVSEAVSTSIGLSGFNRSAASARQMYRDGLQIDADTQATTSIPPGNVAVLRGSANFSSRTVWAYTAGGSLSSAQWASLYTILNDARNGVALSMIGLLSQYAARTKSQPVAIVSGAISASLTNGHGLECMLTENITTIDVSNWLDGMSQVRFQLAQDATGGRTVTWPAGWILNPGTAPQPATTANYVTEIVATSWDGGTTVRLSQGDTWVG